jgi:hypothetical protein
MQLFGEIKGSNIFSKERGYIFSPLNGNVAKFAFPSKS